MVQGDPVGLGDEPTPAEPRVPRQLPPAPWHFTGRGGQLARLTELAGEGAEPIVVANPAAGIGKTALVVHWAHQVADRFSDGLLYVSLRGSEPGWSRRPADVVRGILRAFGMDTRSPRESTLFSDYRTVLAGKRVLLVLDDARDADQVRPLLLPGAESRVVITSRDQLTDLVPYGVRRLLLGVLTPDESHLLLSRRVSAGRAATEPAAVHELVMLCAGLPAALGAVAVAASTSSLTDVAIDLGRDPDVRTAIDIGARARAVVAWARATNPPQGHVSEMTALARLQGSAKRLCSSASRWCCSPRSRPCPLGASPRQSFSARGTSFGASRCLAPDWC